MSMLAEVSPENVLLAARAVFLVFCFILAAVTFTRWRHAESLNAERFAEQSTALTAQLAIMEKSLAEAHRKLDALAEHAAQDVRRPVVSGAQAPSYQIAIRLARSGAPCEELMASCGLTRQEAELVQRLHAPARGPKLAAVG
jgi:hypothetical protein